MFGATFPVFVVHLGVIIVSLCCDCYHIRSSFYSCATFYTSGRCCNIRLLGLIVSILFVVKLILRFDFPKFVLQCIGTKFPSPCCVSSADVIFYSR